MPKYLLTEDIYRKTSSDRRFSRPNIFSQKMFRPIDFSQKTKNVPRQATYLSGVCDIIESYYILSMKI